MKSRFWLAPGLLVLFMLVSPDFQGDTEALIMHGKAMRDCIANGSHAPCPNSSPFAFFQQFVGILMIYARMSDAVIMSLLAHLSVVYFVSTLWLFWKTLKDRTPSAAWLGLLVLATGYILTYGRSSFGEMGGAFLAVGLMSALLKKKPSAQVAMFLFLAALTKDTALPFLLVLGLTCCWLVGNWTRATMVSLACGSVAASLVSITYNYFRFGTFYNASYLIPEFIVPTREIQASFFAAIWISPSGGLALYWPTFTALLGVVCVIAIRTRKLIPVISVLSVLMLLTLGFSRWYTPLGAWSWGSRFMIPWVPPAILVLSWAYSEELRESVQSKLFWPIALLLMVFSLPQFLYFFHPQVWLEAFAAGPEFTLPPGTSQPISPFTSPDAFYALSRSALWKLKFIPMLLYSKTYALWQFTLIAAYLYMLLAWTRKMRAT